VSLRKRAHYLKNFFKTTARRRAAGSRKERRPNFEHWFLMKRFWAVLALAGTIAFLILIQADHERKKSIERLSEWRVPQSALLM
jgi:hypothetical protein